MQHILIDISSIVTKLDQEVSSLYRNTEPFGSVFPVLETLLSCHKQIFSNPESAFFAGKFRTLPSVWWKTTFALAYKTETLSRELSKVKRKTFWEILAWTLDMVWYVHPFLDGNRRSIWYCTNLYLIHEGYHPINWDLLRPTWEKNAYMNHLELLHLLLKTLITIKPS